MAQPSQWAVAQDDAWTALAHWIGKYPTGNKSAPANLSDAEPVKSTLRVILSPAERATLAAYPESTPIEQVGSAFVAHYCKPHDCGNESADIIIDIKTRQMWVGFYKASGPNYRTTWTGNADPALLAPAVLKTLAARHNPF